MALAELLKVWKAGRARREPVALADEETVRHATGAPVGFAGRFGLGVRILADASLRGMRGAVSGANRADEHVVKPRPRARSAEPRLRATCGRRGGDRCPRCEGGAFAEHRGVRGGRSSCSARSTANDDGATFLDAGGTPAGRSRWAATDRHHPTRRRRRSSSNHERRGIVWPAPLAPYGALVVPLAADAQAARDAERLAAELEAAGVDTLLDDRDERPGSSSRTPDLIGLPSA